MSKPFDKILLEEMTKDDELDLMDMGDDDIIDSLMETASINEELSVLFPPEEKYEEV